MIAYDSSGMKASTPFAALLVAVAVALPVRAQAPKMQDVEDSERIISRTVPVRQRFVQLWAGEPGYRDNLGKAAQLPATYVIDKAGQVVERYQGRVPAEAWDRIADLL